MTTLARLLVVALLGAGLPALAADAPAWPPTPELRERMLELQATLRDPAETPEARRAARVELIKLLRSPEAAPVDPDKPRAARAAVPPMPAQSPVRMPPPPTLVGPPPEVATVTAAPRTIPPVDPQTGRVLVPTGRTVTDPATGRVLQPAPGGYIDPATGRFVPGR
jgi:hypothetical protein